MYTHEEVLQKYLAIHSCHARLGGQNSSAVLYSPALL